MSKKKVVSLHSFNVTLLVETKLKSASDECEPELAELTEKLKALGVVVGSVENLEEV
jgi:hypothetical protein